MVAIPRQEEKPQAEREPIPDASVLEAEVISVELRESDRFKDSEGNPSQSINFKFNITEEGEFKDRWVWGSTPPWLNDSPRCKLRHWVEAILDVDLLPPDYLLETDNLHGLPVKVIVSAAQSKTQPGRVVNKVTELRPSRAARKTALQAGPSEPEYEPF